VPVADGAGQARPRRREMPGLSRRQDLRRTAPARSGGLLFVDQNAGRVGSRASIASLSHLGVCAPRNACRGQLRRLPWRPDARLWHRARFGSPRAHMCYVPQSHGVKQAARLPVETWGCHKTQVDHYRRACWRAPGIRGGNLPILPERPRVLPKTDPGRPV
jgi:hypothetical protein